MGDIHSPTPVLLLVAITSRHAASLDWARERIASQHGTLALTSDAFEFTETDYYTATMGGDLKKQFVLGATLIDPGDLPRIKRATNDWEAEYASLGHHDEPRPLNLDPGYITPAKLVLASTKDHAHRLYLADGIYAEITLAFRAKKWLPFDWTYPDYRRGDFQQFFTAAREYLLSHRVG